MEIFRQIMEVFAAVPDWVPLILCPALTVAAAVAFALFGGRRGYPLLAGILGAVGVALMSAGATVAEALCYAALFALIAEKGVKNGWMLWPLRVAVSGKQFTPGGGVELSAILGKERTLERIRAAIGRLA